MPFNKDTHKQLGTTVSKPIDDTIQELCYRIGITKSQFLRKGCMELIWKLKSSEETPTPPVRI